MGLVPKNKSTATTPKGGYLLNYKRSHRNVALLYVNILYVVADTARSNVL